MMPQPSPSTPTRRADLPRLPNQHTSHTTPAGPSFFRGPYASYFVVIRGDFPGVYHTKSVVLI